MVKEKRYEKRKGFLPYDYPLLIGFIIILASNLIDKILRWE